jgi:hypothetical protein
MSKPDQLFAEAKSRLEYARMVARQETNAAGLAAANDKAAACQLLAGFRKTLALFEQQPDCVLRSVAEGEI